MRDIDVRQALHRKVLADHHDDPSTLVLDELGLWYGVARVDIAVVNGYVHGYEIKSDSDTLKRLPEQARIYSAVLDRVTLVAGDKHIDKAREIVPSWWALKTATMGPRGAVHFREVRMGGLNPHPEPLAIAALLWRDELLTILERAGVARGVRGKPRGEVTRRVVETLSVRDLRDAVRACLKARSGWRDDTALIHG